jgi:hypothetical protein
MIRHIYNGVTGLVVLAISFLAVGVSAMADEGDYVNYSWLLMFAAWLLGFILQFKSSTRTLGIIIVSASFLYSIAPFIIDKLTHL